MRAARYLLAALALLATAPIAEAGDGKRLFDSRCGICHAPAGIGTMTLGRRMASKDALLGERRDVPRELVLAVVRRGIGGMPWFTRTELPDEQLAAIADYLARGADQP